jgi:hypothetical protein
LNPNTKEFIKNLQTIVAGLAMVGTSFIGGSAILSGAGAVQDALAGEPTLEAQDKSKEQADKERVYKFIIQRVTETGGHTMEHNLASAIAYSRDYQRSFPGISKRSIELGLTGALLVVVNTYKDLKGINEQQKIKLVSGLLVYIEKEQEWKSVIYFDTIRLAKDSKGEIYMLIDYKEGGKLQSIKQNLQTGNYNGLTKQEADTQFKIIK